MESSASQTDFGRYLLVIDFDHTISEKNTDDWVLRDLLSKETVEGIFAERKSRELPWQQLMKDGFQALHDGNISEDQIIKSIEKIPLVQGFAKFIESAGGHSQCDIIIASDSNTVFINTLLQKHKLLLYVKRVFTNPAHFDNEGHLRLSPHHSHSCQSCEPNICKQEILRGYLQQAHQSGHTYERIFVIGDGRNDFCPCKLLKGNDFIFPRKGYRLMKILDKLSQRGEAVIASIVPWENGDDLFTAFKQITNLTSE